MGDALPPAGTVTGLGRLIEIPAGAVPVQEAARLTEELNPFTDESTTVADFETPGVKVITSGEGWVTKSGFGEVTTTAPEGVTINRRVVECEIPPLDAVTVKGYVPIAAVPDT